MTQDDSDLPVQLAAPALRALTQGGYVRLEQLFRVSEAELKQLHGLDQTLLD